MSGYHTEEEQVEAIKKWWSENGRSVVAGAVLGLGGLFGWRAWVSHQHTQAETASSFYNAVSQAIAVNDRQTAAENTTALQDGFASSPYASLAALELARVKADSDQLDAAAEQLLWAIKHSPQQTVRDIAGLRLARVYVAQSRFDEALQIIEGDFASSYDALRDEIRGDVLVGKGDIDAAREAYDRALNLDGNNEYLQMKRADLGEKPLVDPS